MRQFRAYCVASPEIKICVDREVLAEERRRAARTGLPTAEPVPGVGAGAVFGSRER
jgi:hypothetical protein